MLCEKFNNILSYLIFTKPLFELCIFMLLSGGPAVAQGLEKLCDIYNTQ